MRNLEKDIDISDLLYKSLQEELAGDEKTMLDCWLKDDQNRELYEELQSPEKLFDGVLEMSELDTAHYYRGLLRQIDRKRQMRIWLSIASVAAVLIPMIWLVWPFVHNHAIETTPAYHIVRLTADDRTMLTTDEGSVYVFDDSVKHVKVKEVLPKKQLWEPTPLKANGEVEYNLLATSSRGSIELTLADSTRVWLNAGSRLRYPNRFVGGKREVELVGEAYFEVARNERMPFIVTANSTRIEVLGTQFNVKAQIGEACVTTLVEGCVKVRNKVNDTAVIYPGQQVNAPAVGVMAVKSVDSRFYTAWKRNRFAFQNEPLYAIMEQLSIWYGCTFEFSHPRLANLHFTTMLPRYEDISQVMGILQATREFGFTASQNHIRIVDFGEITN